MESPVSKNKKARGRRPKKYMLEQRRLLDHIRSQRRRKVTMMHIEVSEFELVQRKITQEQTAKNREKRKQGRCSDEYLEVQVVQ